MSPVELAALRRKVRASVEPSRFPSAWRRTLRKISREGGRP